MKRILALAVSLALFGWVPGAWASTGAVWTTDSGCGGVNINLFATKADVYLNGGPQGGGGGLPDGDYYVRVTNPSGSVVLGKTLGPTAEVSGGQFVDCYHLVEILYTGSSGFTFMGYDDTDNNGGEYKVWVSQDPDFSGGTNKTDNFKVEESAGGGNGQGALISGFKFLDLNLDTEFVDEPGISGWKVELWFYTGDMSPSTCGGSDWQLIATALTDGDGYYFFELTAPFDPGYYKVVEIFPEDTACGDWAATTDTCHIINLTQEPYSAENQNFGNVCYNNGGLTMGYWKNWSGETKKAQRYDDTYDSLPIDLGCPEYEVETPEDAYDIFRAARANDDGKKMLAAQLMATELNLLKFDACNYGEALYVGNVAAYEGWTVEEIVAEAEEVLCDEFATTSEVTDLIEVLDQLNNNGEGMPVLVNPQGCEVSYPPSLSG